MAATYIERYCKKCGKSTVCLMTETPYDETFYECMECRSVEIIDDTTGKRCKYVLTRCGDIERKELEDE